MTKVIGVIVGIILIFIFLAISISSVKNLIDVFAKRRKKESSDEVNKAGESSDEESGKGVFMK